MPEHQIPTARRSFARGLRRRQTSLEAWLWRELRDRRLEGWKFRRQAPIEGYVVDFVCFDARLIVEMDGPLHRTPEQAEKDRKRDTVLRAEGFRILRFSDEVAPGRVVEEIKRALSRPPHPTLR